MAEPAGAFLRSAPHTGPAAPLLPSRQHRSGSAAPPLHAAASRLRKRLPGPEAAADAPPAGRGAPPGPAPPHYSSRLPRARPQGGERGRREGKEEGRASPLRRELRVPACAAAGGERLGGGGALRRIRARLAVRGPGGL